MTLSYHASARFRIPSCRRERGSGGNAPWWRSSLIFTARKESQEKTEQGIACSTIELPPRDVGEGRTRTDNHVVWSEVTLISLPGKLEPAAGFAPALSGLQNRHVAHYV